MKTPYSVATKSRLRKTVKDVTEDSVERYLVEETTAYSALCIKTERVSPGFFDRTAVWPYTGCDCHSFNSLTDWLELKRPIGGKFEPGQVPWRNEMRRLGHVALTIYTREAVDDYIRSRVCIHRKRRTL